MSKCIAALSKPERIIHHKNGNSQLLYFTTTSFMRNGTEIVFIGDRSGHPNLYIHDLNSGQERQITHNDRGYMKSYVYFDGLPYEGIGKASVSVDAPRNTIYYIQGRDIRKIDADGNETNLAQYPEGQMTSFTHVSADGKRLCVPTTDARALNGSEKLEGKPNYDIDARVQAENLASYLRVYDTTTGEEIHCEEVPKCWITHVQFSPINSDLILYNHEWASNCGIRRLWLFDGKNHLRLRTEGAGRTCDDWTCHEMWEADGTAIIYHGALSDGRAYLGRMTLDRNSIREIALPSGFKRYGHFTVNESGATRLGWVL